MEKHNVVAVDIAKSIFDLAGSGEPGRVTFRRRLSRGAFLTYLAQLPASTMARIAWAVWKHDNDYVSKLEQAA